MILYRATSSPADAQTIPVGSCWTPEREDAEAYRDNPGFGGSAVVSVDAQIEYLLDLRGDDWAALCAALGCDDRDDVVETYGLDELVWMEQAIDCAAIRARLAIEYSWVAYEDTYPDGAITYVRID